MSSRHPQRTGFKRRALVLALAATAVAGAPLPVAHALTPLQSLRYSPDITVVLGGTTVKHNEVAEDDLGGTVNLVDVGPIPTDAAITAYDRLPNGDQLLAFDTPVSLPGLIATQGDIVRFDGSVYTLELDASSAGIPTGVITDGASEIGPNDLLLSFDITVTVGGITADDEDVVRFHDGTFSLFFDGSAEGVAQGLDLDAVHCIPVNGHLLLSFDGTGTVDGVGFSQEDVLEFTPMGGSWALNYDGVTADAGWLGADLSALSAVSDPPSVLIGPTIKPNEEGGNDGVALGSTRVFGMSTAQAKPGDTCIAIFAVGANGVPDNPPGSVDDELLGTGGTDAEGNFVDDMENPGILLSRPLQVGDRIFAADFCQDRVGEVIAVPVPTPAVSSVGLGLLIGVLALLGFATLMVPRVRIDSQP